MKRKLGMIVVLGMLLLGGCLDVLPGLDPSRPKLAGIFEGGKLYKAGTFNVLELHGSYRQMGRQYGRLLRSDLNAIYDEAIGELAIKEFGNTFEELLAEFQPIFDAYPVRFKEIIRGMAETSGLSEEQLIVLNCLEMVRPAEWGDSPDHCSGIAVWGDYTGGGPLVFGRNYDFPELFKRFTQYFTVTVYNPTDSSVPTATLTYAGVIYLTSGMNRDGLFVELNNGSLSGGDTTYENRTMLPVSLLGAVLDSSSLDELDIAFNSTQTDLAYNRECDGRRDGVQL